MHQFVLQKLSCMTPFSQSKPRVGACGGLGAVVFTAAGNDRVSGAFHKCLERVLGVVVGCGAAYMNLSAQSAVQVSLGPRMLENWP